MNLFDIFEGAIDDLEARRIEDLEAKMDDYTARAKASNDPKYKEAMRHEYARAKAERDNYYKINVDEAPGAETLAHNQSTDASNLQALGLAEEDLEEHGGGGDTPRQWHAYVRAHRADEGFQDFNKVEPYAVCLAGKPVKKFDYYEQARRFHDNWKQKLYREGNMAKAEKITLMPLNLDEAGSPAQQAAIAIAKKKEQGVDEASMAQAAHNPTGAKFGGYYKGTQAGAPRPGQSFGAESSEMEEGAKVDRMQQHIARSEKALGHSKKDAEAIGWATLNKRGYLDNANKKKHNESINFMEWTVAQGSRFANFTANPEVYAAAKAAYVAEGMSNALSNITRRIAQPVNAKTIIKNREQKKDSIKRQHFSEDEGESELQAGQYYVWTVYFDDGTNKRIKVTKDTFDPKTYYAKQNKVVINVDYSWEPHDE
jgi:hypothetical protein